MLQSMGLRTEPARHLRSFSSGRRDGSCRSSWLATVALGFLLLVAASPVGGTGADKKIWGARARKLSGLIIPGFASTRLRAWTLLDCPYSPLNFSPLDPVWIDVRKVLSVLNCWLKCMLLDPVTQEDHPECKSRPDSGLSAITELDPGYITGPASSIWKDWVNWCVEFGIEPDGIIAAPYDWRVSGPVLEKRDLYFHRLRITFETVRKLKGGPSIVFAHSLGNNVFRYFLEWLKLEVAPKDYLPWLDDHIHSFFAVGAPLLGSAETVKAMLSGLSFGLPISEGTARLMTNSYSSSVWMLPLSPNCRQPVTRFGSDWGVAEGKKAAHYVCDDDEFSTDTQDWPVDVVSVDLPSFSDAIEFQKLSAGVPTDAVVASCNSERRSYSAARVADGTFLDEIRQFDGTLNRSLEHLFKYYLEDPIMNPLTPWERPPIKNVYCTYGVDLKTEIGYQFAPSGKPYPDNWLATDIIYETEGGHISSRSGTKVEGRYRRSSGDTTVPYHSLSFCKNWLGPQVNITRTPQSAYDEADVQQEVNVDHVAANDIEPNSTRVKGIKYITFYEDGVSRPGKSTAVWEFDKVNHRNIVRNPVFLRELWLETVHSYHSGTRRSFVPKDSREPLRDEDCYWDYGKARCGFSSRCEYRYLFGDIHLGQSCRLKASDRDVLWQYLEGDDVPL